MSIIKVEHALLEFLTSNEPRVVALSGKWGRGKSYFWNRFVRTQSRSIASSVEYYSYISLFGISDLALLRDAVFENASGTVHLDNTIETPPNSAAEAVEGESRSLPQPLQAALSAAQRAARAARRAGARKQFASLSKRSQSLKN